MEISERVRPEYDTAMLPSQPLRTAEPRRILPTALSISLRLAENLLTNTRKGLRLFSVGLPPNNDIGTDKRRLVQVCCVVW
jgi:hypothetical protein